MNDRLFHDQELGRDKQATTLGSVEDVVEQRIISFDGDNLLAILTTSDHLYLSLPSICTALGLNIRGQLQRVQRAYELATGLSRLSLKTRGGIQQVNCLRLDKIRPWLDGVQKRGLGSTVYNKIAYYQGEVVQAVTRAFSLSDQEGTLRQASLLFIGQVAQNNQEFDGPALSISEFASEIDQQELRTTLTTIPYINSTAALITTNFQEDRAIREATLARKVDWQEDPEFRRMRYIASNHLHVYLGGPEHPLSLPEALQRIRALGETTILTARILLGLWNIRRCKNQLTKDGSAAIRVDEVLEWRGVQKHSRVYPGLEKRFTDGYQWKHKQRVQQDVKLLEQCYLRGQHLVIVRGRVRRFLIDGPYLRVTLVKETANGEDGELVGYFIAPGAWINSYEEHGNLFFAEIDRRIFLLHPHNDQIALRIALYLTERWRQHVKTGTYDQPITMRDLLEASMVAIDEKHLTTRFAPRVEAALCRLTEQGITGETVLLTTIDRNQAHWGKTWLASQWKILPPHELMQQMHAPLAISQP